MSEYTQGIFHGGASILKDGEPMTIEEILASLAERDALAAHVADMKRAMGPMSRSCSNKDWREFYMAYGRTPATSLAKRDARVRRDAAYEVRDVLARALPYSRADEVVEDHCSRTAIECSQAEEDES